MNEAYNKGENYRVHIMFDVLPVENIKAVKELMLKTGELASGIP